MVARIQGSAVFVNGSELQKILSNSAYDSSTYYVYIPWKKGEITVIDVGNSWSGAQDEEFKDVQGRKWIIRRGWKNCR